MSNVTSVPSFPHIPLCRDLSEIVPGKIVLFHHSGGNARHDNDWNVIGYTLPYESVGVVQSYPYVDGPLSTPKFDVDFLSVSDWRDEEFWRSVRYASDAGIVPYDGVGGTNWNPTNTTKIVGYGMELYV